MSRPTDLSLIERSPASTVTALVRGLAILSCFDRPRLELTVSEIARRIGLSQPTTWRLCATLLEHGYLIRGSSGSAVRIGAPALTLGYAAIKGLDFPAIAAPHMLALGKQTGASVSLSLRRGMEMVAVDQISGQFVLANQPVGWSAALSSSPSGLAVLAVLPPPDRQATIEQLRARDTEAWPRRSARIEAANAQFHRDGQVMQTEMFAGQYASVAIPIIEGDQARKQYWALSCGGLRAQFTDDLLAKAADALKLTGKMLQAAAASLPSPAIRSTSPPGPISSS